MHSYCVCQQQSSASFGILFGWNAAIVFAFHKQAYDESRLRKWTGILIVFSSLEYIMIFSLDHFLDGFADILVDNVGRK